MKTMIGDARSYPYTANTNYCGNQKQNKFNNGLCGSPILSSLGICLLVVGYTLLGALTFMVLEGRTGTNLPQDSKISEHDLLRSQTVEKLWSITEDLNILYKDNWTRLAEQEVLKFQKSLIRKFNKNIGAIQKNYNWNFPSAFLYSLTLITTIGYSNVTPRTSWGRLITIAYALVGIPLMLVYLSTVGDALAQCFRELYGKLIYKRKKVPKKEINEKNEHTFVLTKTPIANHITEKKPFVNPCALTEQHRVPILMTLLIVFTYVAAGAVLFNKLENWTIIEGSYFCFTSLGTIGFGELVPGMKDSGSNSNLSVFASSAYILIGMAIIAMCFSLLQDETVILAKKASFWCQKTSKTDDEEAIPVKSS